MIVGVPKEIKNRENRVACTPGMARLLAADGHEVRIERGAGEGSGFNDAQYAEAGVIIVDAAAEAWAADLVLKVKEPQESEFQYFRRGLMIFGYFHLAAERRLTDRLLESGATAIAIETVAEGRHLPMLEPMSEIAGRMSAIVGAFYLSRAHGGSGVLLSGVPGVAPGRVMVLGGGTAGVNAARMAVGLGAEVTILDISLDRLRELDALFNGRVRTLYSTEQAILDELPRVDLLIGAVLLPGAKAPRIVRREMLKSMRPGSVIVDIAIDQGGCLETSRPTTHDDPIFEIDGIRHYCVTNMPAAYARTATQALANATTPYVRLIARHGLQEAIRKNPALAPGINTLMGNLTSKPVALAHGLPHQELSGFI